MVAILTLLFINNWQNVVKTKNTAEMLAMIYPAYGLSQTESMQCNTG